MNRQKRRSMPKTVNCSCIWTISAVRHFAITPCAGSQCLPMLTEDNVPVESDWEVYADEQIGWITGWEEEWLGWRLDSRGAQPGAEGFVHAKKDGKTYAVRIVVTGYPISAYI